MLASLRSALLICAALSASDHCSGAGRTDDRAVDPGRRAPALPKIAVPELLDPQGEPQLAAPNRGRSPDRRSRPTMPISDAAVAVKPTGDLASMVAQLRSSDAGSRELECLATGIYFESKSEPLAGQLAVGKVIANRAKAAAASRRPIAACCSSAANSPSSTAIRCRRCRTRAGSGRPPSRSPRSSTRTSRNSAVGNALFFHARYVSPGWRLKRVASIGNHVFYR